MAKSFTVQNLEEVITIITNYIANQSEEMNKQYFFKIAYNFDIVRENNSQLANDFFNVYKNIKYVKKEKFFFITNEIILFDIHNVNVKQNIIEVISPLLKADSFFKGKEFIKIGNSSNGGDLFLEKNTSYVYEIDYAVSNDHGFEFISNSIFGYCNIIYLINKIESLYIKDELHLLEILKEEYSVN